MIKKIPFLILSFLLLVSPLQVKAETKSITKYGNEDQISIAHKSLEINYNGKKGRLYYGDNGIDMLFDDDHVHIDTDFAVKRMIVLDDLNGDNYPEFITWQNASEFSDQVIVLSGKDGKVIDSLRFTYNIYNDNYSDFIDVNSSIQQFYSDEKGFVYIISDYSLYKYDLINKEMAFVTEFKNNIWKMTRVFDCDEDGREDFALTGQDGVLYFVDSETGRILIEEQLAQTVEKEEDFGWQIAHFSVQMNLWDIFYENGRIYVTSENGKLYVVDKNGSAEYDISVMSDEEMMNIMINYQVLYDRSTQSQYIKETGLMEYAFMGYRIVDKVDSYMLIEAYMGNDFSYFNIEQNYIASGFPAFMIVYDMQKNEIVSKINIPNNPFYGMQEACFGKYNGETVICAVTEVDQESFKATLYSLKGETVYQKNIASTILDSKCYFSILNRNGHYEIEVNNRCSFALSENLEYEGYTYDITKYAFYCENEEYIYLMKYSNGKFTALQCLDKKLNPVWQYDYQASYLNNGISFITKGNYNKDGYEDFLMLAQQYNDKNETVSTYFIVVDGNTGKVLLNRNLKLGTYYDEKNKKHTYYEIASEASLIRDVDKDGKAEILLNDEFITSKSFKKNGYISRSVDAEGNYLDAGDINGDGFKDIAVVTNKETRLYQSKLSYSYGYYNVEYVKTKTVRKNVEKLENSLYASVFIDTKGNPADVNNDGAYELIHLSYNDKGYEVYTVVDGKTLKDMYNLCPDGVRDYGERYAVFEYDVNNDGYNEIIGSEDYATSNIYDGKTGNLLIEDVSTWTRKGDYYIKDEYHPNYIVPFYGFCDIIYFYKAQDVNGDGVVDYVNIQSGYDYSTYENYTALKTIDGKSGKIINEEQFNKPLEGLLSRIENCDNMMINDVSGGIALLDINTMTEEAVFSIDAQNAYYLNENNIMVVSPEGEISVLDIQKEFDLVSDIPQTTENHILDLKWNSKLDYSIMSVYDNDELVYRGQDDNCQIELMEGRHTISLQLDDGRGKSSARNYSVEVVNQHRSNVILYVMPVIMLAICFFLAMYQKLRIKAAAKAVNK